ncbi:MAG: twin-arginine translocase TatA/TatE family subunit, partial [Nitriliruptoraceae bacterium]|nr:twin-arginine translocase TatA/TatE family subunit [Nitriliruptoraceae bacterium]
MPGFQELLVIGVVALLLFGPDRLPELARNAGQLLAKLRTETSRNVEELGRMSELQELRRELGQLRREIDGAAGDVRRSAGRAVSGGAGRGGGGGAAPGAPPGRPPP